MKVFLSADIEGTAGIADWDETERTHADWTEFRALMTEEVAESTEENPPASDEFSIFDSSTTAQMKLMAPITNGM